MNGDKNVKSCNNQSKMTSNECQASNASTHVTMTNNQICKLFHAL